MDFCHNRAALKSFCMQLQLQVACVDKNVWKVELIGQHKNKYNTSCRPSRQFTVNINLALRYFAISYCHSTMEGHLRFQVPRGTTYCKWSECLQVDSTYFKCQYNLITVHLFLWISFYFCQINMILICSVLRFYSCCGIII